MTIEVLETIMISSPRPVPTLQASLDSLAAAGFHKVQAWFDCKRSGCYVNWKRAAKQSEILDWFDHVKHVCDTDGRRILICEDDIKVSAGLFEFLIEPDPIVQIPSDGVVSLYCARDAQPSPLIENAWRQIGPMPKKAIGALATMWTPRLLRSFLDSDTLPNKRDNTDHAIGVWCKATGTPFYVHSPSFVKHTAAPHFNSALQDPGGTLEGRQCARWLKSVDPWEVEEPRI